VNIALPKKVWDGDHAQFGLPTGGTRRCQLEGCSGTQVGVRWPDGKLTWPCTKGITTEGDEWEIGFSVTNARRS
jgi:hypothetical protein